MDRYIRNAIAAFVIGLTFSGIAAAQAIDNIDLTRNWKFCPGEVFELPQEIFQEWVPVGCEVVDCCPGCPGMDKINWRIHVEGAPLESLTMKFNRLPKDIAAGLKLGGTAQGTAERMLIGRGMGTISGLPVEIAGRAPVAQIEVGLDQAWMQDQARKGESAEVGDVGDGDGSDSGHIIIEQYYGKYRVNEYKLKYRFPLCPRPLGDRIVLQNNASGDSASVLVDARRAAGCVEEESRRGTGIIGMGNVLANAGCRSEVAVFSDDDAMRLVEGVGVWTNALGDTLNVNLTPDRLMAPVDVWLVRTGAFATASGDINNANLLYNSNNAGIGFTPTFRFVSGNAAAVAAIGTGCANAPGLLAGSPFFTPGRLNVYYVDAAFTGVNCNASRNIQYVGTTANNQTLAHEFGHSMSLDHTNGNPAFPVTNVMVGGGAGRTHFSDGQSFRMNAQCSSTLNVNGVRTGPMRRCNSTILGNVTCPIAMDAHCPPLATDALPK